MLKQICFDLDGECTKFSPPSGSLFQKARGLGFEGETPLMGSRGKAPASAKGEPNGYHFAKLAIPYLHIALLAKPVI